MSNTTGIEWTEKTWNPWMGCTKVSPGCAHCYAEREHLKYKLPDFAAVRRSKTTFNAPLKWKEPARVFTCSWSDWFHEGADAWRAEAWDIIRRTPHLTYQILTKRPERILFHLPDDWGDGWPNVWLGVSVENQRWTTRTVELAKVPAHLRFLSCEPLLGPLDVGDALGFLGIGWVIAGGESGANARPCDEAWLRSLAAQCKRVGVPFFLKQLGGHPDARAHEKAVLDGVRHTAMPRGEHE
jgi:protein gp37